MTIKVNGAALEWAGVQYAVQDHRGAIWQVETLDQAESWLAQAQFRGEILWRTIYATGWGEMAAVLDWEKELL
jgi:hypothetical protein